MTDYVDQRSAIKFCLRDDISAAGTFRILQKAFGVSTMSQKNVYKWYKEFKQGRERVENLDRPGRPSTSTDEKHIKKVKELVLENRRLTIRELVDMVGISVGSVQKILKDHLGLRKVKSHLVPKSLEFFEKEPDDKNRLDDEYLQKIKDNQQAMADKTSKKRAKRQKNKEKQKATKKRKLQEQKTESIETKEDESSNDDEGKETVDKDDKSEEEDKTNDGA